MLNRYASAEVYLVYSHLSGMSHTSIETANAYLEWTGGGTFEIRDEAADPGLWSTWPRPPPAATATGTRPAAVAPSSSPKRPRPVHPCCAPAWPWRHRCWPLKMRRPCLTPPLTPTWRPGHCTVLGCSSHMACGCGAASRLATPARRCAPRGTPSTRSAPMPGQNARAGSSAQPASAAISDHRRPGRAGPATAPDRAAGRRRAKEPGDRLAALPIAPNRPQPPIPDLPKARRHVATEPAAVVGATPGPV